MVYRLVKKYEQLTFYRLESTKGHIYLNKFGS